MIDLRYGRCCLESLREMPRRFVHCCVTSPPYYGLRNYGIKPSVWGGDSFCSHHWTDASWKADRWGDFDDDTTGTKQRSNAGSLGHRGQKREASRCSKCRAWRGCLGNEPSPAMYVSHLVMVFAEVWRVLRDDGTLWLNLGDSYAAARSYQVPDTKHKFVGNSHASKVPDGMKPKDLMGPWAVAFALRDAGWYLRSDVIWAKSNGMPESMADRPTRSHEYVFLLTKGTRYYYDAAAVSEPCQPDTPHRYLRGRRKDHKWADGPGNQTIARTLEPMAQRSGNKSRNKRSVWSIPTKPFRGAHFAIFPPALIEPCVLAGCPVGGTVLDCFAGSGTTCEVAQRLGRDSIGLDASSKYLALAKKRCGI